MPLRNLRTIGKRKNSKYLVLRDVRSQEQKSRHKLRMKDTRSPGKSHFNKKPNLSSPKEREKKIDQVVKEPKKVENRYEIMVPNLVNI